MPLSKTIIRHQIPLKYKLSFSSPTEDIANVATALKYLNPDAAYCLIPGIENSAVYDPEKIVLQLLPHTQNIVLDICLPYIEINKKRSYTRHLGRYILCNKQLVGIRIKPSQNWGKSKCQTIEVSPKLLEFYQSQGIQDYRKDILIGEFIIYMKNFKIAPLFESELSSTTDNTIRNILSEYYGLGCQIFSVMSDIPEQRKKNIKNPIEILKNFRRQSAIVAYYGMNLAPSLSECYTTEAFAVQGNEIYRSIQIDKLDHSYQEEIIVDLNQTKRNRKLNLYFETNPLIYDIQILQCSQFRIKPCFAKNRIIKSDEMELQASNRVSTSNLISFYLWYLFVSINKKTPFVIPLPMAQRDSCLLKLLLDLASKTNLEPKNFVIFIKFDPKMKLNRLYESYDFKIVQADRISLQFSPLHLYFPLKQRILNTISEKSVLAQLQKRIVCCCQCLGDNFFNIVYSQEKEENDQNKLIDEDGKFVEIFLKKKSGLSLQQFYYDAARYYPKHKINDQFLEQLYKLLQLKAKKQCSGSSLQAFILQNSYDQISHIFRNASLVFVSGKNQLNLKAQEDHNQGEDPEPKQLNFRNFIRKIKHFCLGQKKNYYSCHICSCLFSKKQKSDYGRYCYGCSNFLCYNCFDIKTGSNCNSQDMFQQCLICLKKCDCESCLNKNSKDHVLPFAQSSVLENQQRNQPLKRSQQTEFIAKISRAKAEEKQNTNFPQLKQQLGMQQAGLRLKTCYMCELYNRIDRHIQFQCSNSKCRQAKCLSCEKAENSKRAWVLRGQILCNKCYQEFSIIKRLNQELKAFGNQNRQLRFQNERLRVGLAVSTYSSSNLYTNNLYTSPIIEEPHQDYQSTQPVAQKGSATPIFERQIGASNALIQSPVLGLNKKSPSQNESQVSFGDKPTGEMQARKRKNSSNSSQSEDKTQYANKDKGMISNKKQQQVVNKKRSNSSESNSFDSFAPKVNRQPLQKQSLNSPDKSQKGKNSRQSSVQSGQYEGSSSSQKGGKQKINWAKDYHNSQQQQGDYNIGKGSNKFKNNKQQRNNFRQNVQKGNYKQEQNKGYGQNKGYKGSQRRQNWQQKKNNNWEGQKGNAQYNKKEWKDNKSNRVDNYNKGSSIAVENIFNQKQEVQSSNDGFIVPINKPKNKDIQDFEY